MRVVKTLAVQYYVFYCTSNIDAFIFSVAYNIWAKGNWIVS